MRSTAAATQISPPWATVFGFCREEEKATISWKIKFRDGREKNFVSPIRTTPWGSIKSPADYEAPTADAMNSQELAHEPEALHIDALPTLTPGRLKQGVL